MKNSESMPPAPSPTSSHRLWMVPLARNPFFSGRDEELQAMATLLKEGQSDADGLVLSGPAGVGKTQLALEYACLQREEYLSVFWALAGTRETLHAAYSDIARLLDLPEKEEPEQWRVVKAVKLWLAENPAWLLILDDANDPSLLKDFLPATFSGHVLLTTRGNGFGKLARRLRLKSLTVEQSSALLLRRCGLLRSTPEVTVPSSKDDEAARAIVTQLEGLPLALNLAGAYIAETGCGLPGYLGRLRAVRIASARAGGNVEQNPPGPLQKVVHLASDKAAKVGSVAAQILALCTFLAPDEIPVGLLTACFSTLQKQNRKLGGNTSKRNVALAVLEKYGLLEWDREAQILSLAREVQAVWRASLSPEEEKSWAEQAVRAIGSLYATLDINAWEACQRLQPHAQICAAHIECWHLELVEGAWLLHHMGWYLHTRGQYIEAQRYEERALTIYRAVLGNEHPSTAMILNNLAITYEDQGKLNDAVTLHTQALTIRRSMLGENHPETAASLNNLALVYHDLGKLDEADSFYRQALDLRRQLLGEMHPDVAALLADLAALSSDLGKFQDALNLYQQALVIRRKTLGTRHPDTIAVLSALAEAYLAQGDYDEALRWHQQALTAQRKMLGHEHPTIAVSFNSLAAIYQAQGKLDEAAFWFQHSLAILNNLPGQAQSATARSLERLAIAYEEQEQHEKAEALYQQALAIYRRSSDDSRLDIARCSYNLALLYHDRKRNAEARPLLERALALWQEVRGPNHADTRKAREKYEQIMQKTRSVQVKRTPSTESQTPQAIEPERNNSGGLKSLAQALRRVGRKKT